MINVAFSMCNEELGIIQVEVEKIRHLCCPVHELRDLNAERDSEERIVLNQDDVLRLKPS